jgi:hypothetical protein
MNKIVTSVIALAFVVIPTQAQVKRPLLAGDCDLKEANSPSIRGVRLGMTPAQALAVFPGARERTEIEEALKGIKAGGHGEVVYLTFYPAADAPKGDFAGVDSVSVGVHDGRVIDLLVIYVGISWSSVDEWVGKLSETLRLPGLRSWAVGPSEMPNKVLKCKGVEVEAGIQGGGASIRIRNTAALNAVEDSHNAGEKKERRMFRP